MLYINTEKENWIRHGATDNDLNLLPHIIDLQQLLKNHFNDKQYKEVIQSIKNSVLTAFYTPGIVPRTLFSVLKREKYTTSAYL